MRWYERYEWWHQRHRHHRHHQRFSYIRLGVDNFGVILEPELEFYLMVDVTVGRSLALSIEYLDQNGNPMLTNPTPDAPPSWTNTTPETETITPSADGLTCTAQTLAVGTDSIGLTVVVGGQDFVASLAVSVGAVPQVLTKVGINATVQ